jgi:hypothetical protein
MDPYLIAKYLHILGAFGLSAALGLEWLAVGRLRRATTREDALTWMGVMSLLRRIGPGSLVLVLLPGLYLAAVRWRLDQWPGVALLGLVLVAAVGGLLTGRTMAWLGPRIGREEARLAPEVAERLHRSVLPLSVWTRIGLVLGVTALMVFKPDLVTSLVVLAAGTALGLLCWAATTRRPGARRARG